MLSYLSPSAPLSSSSNSVRLLDRMRAPFRYDPLTPFLQ